MKHTLRTLGSVLLLMLMWQGLYLLKGGVGVPSIYATFLALINSLPTLLQHLLVSFVRLFCALLIAFVGGSIIGFVMAKIAWVDNLLSPLIYLINPIPKVPFLPIIMILVGISDTARVLLLVLVVIFPFIVTARDALKAMPKTMQISVQSLKLSLRSQLVDVLIPYCAPYLFSALRSGFGISIAVLFFVETFVNQVGIGYYIMNRWQMVNYPDMYAGIVLLSVFGFVVYRLLDLCELKLCPWRFLSKKQQS